MSRFLKAVCITKPMHSHSLLRDYQKPARPSVLYLLLSLRVSPTPNTPTFRSPCWPSFVPWSHPVPSQGLFCAVLPALSYTISHFYQNANTWDTDPTSVSTWPLGMPHFSPTLYSKPLIKLWNHANIASPPPTPVQCCPLLVMEMALIKVTKTQRYPNHWPVLCLLFSWPPSNTGHGQPHLHSGNILFSWLLGPTLGFPPVSLALTFQVLRWLLLHHHPGLHMLTSWSVFRQWLYPSALTPRPIHPIPEL